MFLNQFNKTQKQSFLFLAKELIEADNKICEQELNLLEKLKLEMEVDNNSDNSFGSIERALEAFANKKVKIILLIELLGLAHADGVYCEQENKIINKISNILKVPESELYYLDNWVLRQMSLVNEIKNKLNE